MVRHRPKGCEGEMKLAEEDVELFLKMHPKLLFYANQQLRIVGIIASGTTRDQVKKIL